MYCTAVGVEVLLLMIGKTLGHYQINSQLGKGGIGEVYQAKEFLTVLTLILVTGFGTHDVNSAMQVIRSVQ